jgi:hypothetical protein
MRYLMSEELIDLHEEILAEFERRIEERDDIPDDVVREMKEHENLGLGQKDILKDAIEQGLGDEAE